MAQMWDRGNHSSFHGCMPKIRAPLRMQITQFIQRLTLTHIDVQPMLAALEALKKASSHRTIATEVFQHPSRIARAHLADVREDLIQVRRQIATPCIPEEGARSVAMGQPDRLLPRGVARRPIA